MPQRWSRQRVIEAIQSRRAAGLPLRGAYATDRYLYVAAHRSFGGWHAAILAAGLPAKPRRRWSAEAVMETIRERKRQGLPLVNVRGDDASLGYAARRFFGTWEAALIAAGLEPAFRWNAQRVLDAIRARRKQGLPLDGVSIADKVLYRAAHRYLGGWCKALEAAGISVKHRRKWTKQSVIDAIRLRHERGLKLTRVCREDCGLHRAAIIHFGRWRNAVQAAGLEPKRRREWSRQSIVATILKLHERGQLGDVWRSDTGLYGAAKHYFGGFSKAMEAAGLPPNRRHWTRQAVLEAIRTALPRVKRIAQIWNDPALSSAANVYFGSRRKALEAIGIKVPPLRRWTRKALIDAIRRRHEMGFSLANVEDKGLDAAARREFGSWSKAMEAAGLEPCHRRWSREKILAALRAHRRRRRRKKSKEDRALEAAAVRYFGSLREARLAAGLDPDSGKWSREEVIEAIQDRYVKGLPMQAGQCKDNRLLSAAKRFCGSWSKAVVAAGLGDKTRQRGASKPRRPSP